jgi:hypothetical protein
VPCVKRVHWIVEPDASLAADSAAAEIMTVSKKAGSKCKHYKCLLIDLDDTLYRQDEIPKLVRHNIEREHRFFRRP